MQLEYAMLGELSQQAGGSFYVFDEDRFVDNYLRFQDRLRQHHANSKVAYALKANYMPAICELIAQMHGWAEVVSRFEYDVARRALPAERLIFNGPIKRERDLRAALRDGAWVNIDSFNEIQLLKTLAKEFDEIRIGLRINFASLPASRFGFEVESGELDNALKALSDIENLKVSGLHCHVSDRERGVKGHVERIRLVAELAERLAPWHRIETLNIGGGLLGTMPDNLRVQFRCGVPSLEEYADAIGLAFKRHVPDASMQLIVEPGISMVADTQCLVAEVIEVKHRRDGCQALLDTSINSVNPTRSRCRPELHAVTAGPPHAGPLRSYRLVGHTCMEHDIISEAFDGRLEAGDYLVFENRGAYSLNYTPPFITPAPAVFSRKGRLLKRADDCASVLATHCTG